MVYVGIDVHRKRSQVAVLDEAGTQLSNRNYENSSGDLRAVLDELEPGTGVAFEAAYGWGWLADLLEECELEAHLAHPSACKPNALATPIRRLDAETRDQAEPDPRVEALRSLYGVGLITSMTLVAEIGEISRFPTARKLCAWAGLTPSVHNSDVKVRHGHITKA